MIALLSCCWLVAGMSTSFAQAPNAEPVVIQSTEAPQSAPANDEQAAEKERVRQAAVAGLMVLGLVAVVLVLLLLLASWWAHRLRRQLERPLPKQQPGDPLWYLRKGASGAAESDDDSKSDASAQ